MTESEAIEKWKQVYDETDSIYKSNQLDNMFKSAIQALEEIKQYRAIGTVEEVKELKEKEKRFDRNIKMFNEIGLEIRAKAIDEFAENIETYCSMSEMNRKMIKKIAEQMKAGGKNE